MKHPDILQSWWQFFNGVTSFGQEECRDQVGDASALLALNHWGAG